MLSIADADASDFIGDNGGGAIDNDVVGVVDVDDEEYAPE